jgi:2-phosphosulfolactate phosphatase
VALDRRCFPVPSLEAATALAEKLDGLLLVGELGGNMPYGFHLTNSPAALALRPDTSRPMILLSTSGAKVLCEAKGCGAGTRGEFREEGQMCCAWIAEGLMNAGYRPRGEQTAKLVERWSGAPVDAFLGSKSVECLTRTGLS